MNRQTRNRAAGVISLAVLVVVVGAVAATSLNTAPTVAEAPSASSASTAASSSMPATLAPSASIELPADFEVAIDPGLEPSIAEVDGLQDGAPARAVGRMAEGNSASDVVLDELIVSTETRAELDAFLARWNGTVLDEFAPVDGVTDYLVRIDPTTADRSSVARNLGSFEVHDDIAVSDEAMLRLLAILAAETAQHGTQVALNPIEIPAGIPEGTAQEAGKIHDGDELKDLGNPFGWSYLRGGGAQDFAVGPAWQLL